MSVPFFSSFESLSHPNIRDSAVIRAQAFSVAQSVPVFQNGGKVFGESDPFSTKPGGVCVCVCVGGGGGGGHRMISFLFLTFPFFVFSKS